jgi:PAS domain S-box-containing protein
MKNKEEQGRQLTRVTLALAREREENAITALKLALADMKLAEQSDEKQKRALELFLANGELVLQNNENERRTAELVLLHIELAFQNEEKEKRAAELAIANVELVFQNNEKAKRVAELTLHTNEELLARKNDEEYLGHLAAIVEFTDNAIISKTLDGIIKSWNGGSEKMFGYTSAEAIGNHISLIIPKEHINEEKSILEKICNNKAIEHYETIRRKKNGQQIHISLTVSPIKDRAGRIIGVSKIACDITNRKKSEANLIRLNKELVYQIEEKQRQATELVIANKGLRQFAYVASHDLQEPLRTVSNYMQAFEEDYVGQLDDNALKFVRSVENATKRMSMVIKSLLNFSRFGHNTKVEPVNCKTLLCDVINDLATMVKDSKTTIEVGDMPILNVCATEMRQVFQNLITNAIKFRKTDTEPKIQIRSEQIDEKWKFSVSDNGIGIDPVHFERIFDIFQRLHTNAEYEGNGIGLANCKQIIELHKGQIGVESCLGQGTTFYFTLPTITL